MFWLETLFVCANEDTWSWEYDRGSEERHCWSVAGEERCETKKGKNEDGKIMIIEGKREMKQEIRIPRLCSVFSHSWGDNCGFLKRVVLSFFSVETSYFSRRAMPEGEHHHRHHHSSSRAHSHSHKNEIVQKSEDPLASVINHHRHKHRHYHHHSTNSESQANKYIWREFEYWAIESKKSQKMQLWIGILRLP